jgi:hypothetical protein
MLRPSWDGGKAAGHIERFGCRHNFNASTDQRRFNRAGGFERQKTTSLLAIMFLWRRDDAGTVLDPFGGAGTTGLVADRLQRNAILIELNPATRQWPSGASPPMLRCSPQLGLDSSLELGITMLMLAVPRRGGEPPGRPVHWRAGQQLC